MINIKDFLNDSNPKITILKDLIDILNYKKIILLSDNKIVIDYSNQTLTINGNNLSIIKLLNDEMAIQGNFTNIEFR